MSLTCSVNKGDLPLKIFWRFNNKSVENEFGVVVSMVNKRLSTLSIDSVQADNSGEYKCVAKNSAGSTTYSAQLNVNGTLYLHFIISYSFNVVLKCCIPCSTTCHFTL
mgnify:CR=1 FL=1